LHLFSPGKCLWCKNCQRGELLKYIYAKKSWYLSAYNLLCNKSFLFVTTILHIWSKSPKHNAKTHCIFESPIEPELDWLIHQLRIKFCYSLGWMLTKFYLEISNCCQSSTSLRLSKRKSQYPCLRSRGHQSLLFKWLTVRRQQSIWTVKNAYHPLVVVDNSLLCVWRHWVAARGLAPCYSRARVNQAVFHLSNARVHCVTRLRSFASPEGCKSPFAARCHQWTTATNVIPVASAPTSLMKLCLFAVYRHAWLRVWRQHTSSVPH
jgi:hypothetical protein